MKIAVNHLCSGHGRCYTVSPELLECDAEGFVTIKNSEKDVPAGMEAAARRAMGACPEDAISITE